MTSTIRYGVIGCGMMGQEHLKNIALLPGAQVAAIYEPDATMRGIAAQLAPSAEFVNSISDMLAISELDCLLIVSPNFCHADQLMQIAATRQMPLLVEKPLLTNPADIPRLKTLYDSYSAPIWVAMEYRYMPPISAFLEKVAQATGGAQMLTIREHRFPFLPKIGDWNRFNRYTGGTFVEKCCHFFDLMRLVMVAEPSRITASAGQSVNHLDEKYGGETPDIIDNGYVIVDFRNGARAMLELCMFAEGARYQEEISAVGASGKIEVFVPGPTRFWPDDLGVPPIAKLEISPRAPKGPVQFDIPVDPTLLEAGDHNGSTFYQHQQFLKLIKGEIARPEVTFLDGLRSVEMGLAAQHAAISGTCVDL